jgi:hypothetical protein
MIASNVDLIPNFPLTYKIYFKFSDIIYSYAKKTGTNTDTGKEALLEKAFKDPFVGLGGALSLYRKVRQQMNDITFANVKEFMQSQEVNQVVKPRSKTSNSYVATAPLEQFQIDLIYMPKNWWNDGYKYILPCNARENST